MAGVRGPCDHTQDRTFADVLRTTVADRPDEVAYRFLADAENESRSITYGELELRAVSVARAIISVTDPGDRVLLLFAPGLEFIEAFLACTLAGVIAVPVAPPRPERPLQAQTLIASIARSCHPRLILTGGEYAAMIHASVSEIPELARIPWMNADEIASSSQTALREGARAEDVALLQFTSGATGDPKGVMVTHANLLHNERMLQTAWGHWAETEYAAGACWLPPYHDMGLIGGVLYAVWLGFPGVIIPPLGILQRPSRWLSAISRYRADLSGGPNFIFDTCSRRIRSDEYAGLDLSAWRCAPVGAEPVRADTLREFARTFEPYGFRPEAFFPCYGLAEATLLVTGSGAGTPPVIRTFTGDFGHGDSVRRAASADFGSHELVSCGHAWLDQQLEIVDAGGDVLPAGSVGEIWVSGPSVAAGYWGQPEATTEIFEARTSARPGSQYLRTGDLGFVDEGELFVVGRLKDLIIIHGKNFHPQDIESAVQSAHPGLKPDCGAAFGVDVGGEEHLVVVQEIDRQTRPIDVGQLAWEIRKIVSRRFELRLHDVVFARNGTLPKTTSGKIRRGECRRRYLNQELIAWTRKSSEPHEP